MASASIFSGYVVLLLSALAIAAPGPVPESRHSQSENTSSCRCFPGDSCWPTTAEWNQFNGTLGGKLIATIPIASSCHYDSYASYNAGQCAQLQSVWGFPQTHYESSSSVMAPFFANRSCDPFTPPSAQCVIGTYVQYAVNASSTSDYQKTIAFAQKNNIRIVIRNTGHDYFGKSTGAGALGIWTHNVKDIQVINYSSSNYTGNAIKVGAGVQNFEAQAVAHAHGLTVVGGNCPTVGFAGGYTQGGGHGPLVSKYGLAADQVLEWEVVTGTGELLTATPSQNSDLYWALCGGGGGTFGVVLSMTSKAHSDMQVAAANLTFTNAGVSQDTFYNAIQTFLVNLPAIVDAGAVSIWLLMNTTFLMQPTTAPGLTTAQLQDLLNPTLAQLNKSGMPYEYFIGEFPTYLDSFEAMNPTPNVTEFSLGGRLMPRSLVASNSSASSLTNALRYINDNGAVISGVSTNASRGASRASNSVNPAWRDALFDAVVGTPWSRTDYASSLAGQQAITNTLLPQLEQLTPGGGAYLNEGDIHQPNYQQVFYGGNYAALKDIKDKYDPQHTFYALTGVGSEYWTQQSDGRLCQTNS